MSKHLALVLVLLAGCASMHPPADAGKNPQVTHVVLCWLKQPGNEVDRQKLIDTSYGFQQIPGVVGVFAGKAIPSTRPVVDSSFDVAIVMTFKDEAAMQNYEQHPAHKQAVSDVLKPLTAKLLIYDIQRANASLMPR